MLFLWVNVVKFVKAIPNAPRIATNTGFKSRWNRIICNMYVVGMSKGMLEEKYEKRTENLQDGNKWWNGDI